jgi:hypothetical protein
MPPRFLASLLFCLALLMQAASPLANGEMIDASRNGDARLGFVLCRLLHSDQASTKADVNSAQSQKAPAPNRAGHDHHSCSLCQLGSNSAFFEPYAPPIVNLYVAWLRPVFVGRVQQIAIFRFIVSPPARAPPSFA